jgi:hypothetical protein
MKRTTLTLMLVAAGGAAANLSLPARADAPADLKVALDELNKVPEKRDAALVDAKLGAALLAPGQLSAAQYYQARILQEQRRVAAQTDKTAPQQRQMLNQAAADIVTEITKQYVSAEPAAAGRFAAYKVQLALAGGITDSARARSLEADIVKAMLADLEQRSLAAAGATDEDREGALQIALGAVAAINDPAIRRQFLLAVYDRYTTLRTPGARMAIIQRAAVHAAGGEIPAAVRDFQQIVDDAAAPQDLKSKVRHDRMQMLSGCSLWKEAKADAVMLSKQAISEASGPLFPPLLAAEAKRHALRVLLASGEMDAGAYIAAIDQLCVEALRAGNLLADEKSALITDLLVERATELAGRYQWEPALGWAKAAYDIAPASKVPATVTLLQQILANRSRKPVAKDGFNLSRDAKDIAAAGAFYARQSGLKRPADVADTVPLKPEQLIKLAPDLSNQTQFPRQLVGVAAPLDAAVKAVLQKVAAEHADPSSRALAWGLIGEPAKALEVMCAAINALELESPRLTPLTNFMARFVRAKLESVALANAFLESQVDGPAGKDGKFGTADDKPNPLTAKE